MKTAAITKYIKNIIITMNKKTVNMYTSRRICKLLRKRELLC